MGIELRDVSYDYSQGTAMETHALHHVNLKIEDGEFLAIIGHTGSGKSTLIQHFNGLEKPTSGEVLFDGVNIYQKGFSLKKLRTQVGLVFQYPEHQLFELDVITDVCFGPKNQGLAKETCLERAKAALQMVGLDESYYVQSPFSLSGGEKRRVAIAGVLAMEPRILVLDEPTAGLDPQGRDEIFSCLLKLHREKGMTVVLVSHSMEDVARYAQRIVVMNGGEKVLDDAPRAVFSHYRELEKMGLAAPQITYLMHDLKEAGFAVPTDCLTLEEAREAILASWTTQEEK